MGMMTAIQAKTLSATTRTATSAAPVELLANTTFFMSDQTYNIDPGTPKGGGDNGAPIDMPRTEHGEDFVKDHAVPDAPSTTQPSRSGN